MPFSSSRPSRPGEWPDESDSFRSATTTGVTTRDAVRGYPVLPAITALCLEALDGALTLVRADGGELALLNTDGATLVTRARCTHPPRLPRIGYGSPSRPSQPLNATPLTDDVTDPLDDQITQLLPSAQLGRVYHRGQGLIGTVWKRREPVLLRPENITSELTSSLLIEPDAPQHLAVPIIRPDRLDRLGGRGPVIGVLRVFTRDEMWSYTTNDARLLELHADRLGRSLAMYDSASETVRQDDLAAVLRELGGVGPTLEEIFARVGEIIIRQASIQSFCAFVRIPESDDVTVEFAARRGAYTRGPRLPIADLPPVAISALQGEVALDAMPPSGAGRSLFARLGWESEAGAVPMMAAPLRTPSHVSGALLITSPSPEAITPETTTRLAAIALATAVFVENAQLVEGARRSVQQFHERHRQLAALNNAVLTLNASLDENANLQALADQASLVTSAQVCAVLVRDEEAGALVCRALAPQDYPQRRDLLGLAIPLTWRNIGDRLKETTFLVEETFGVDGAASHDATQVLQEAGANAFLATPIARQEDHLGALLVFTPGQPAYYPPAEISLLQALGSQAAIAISNARLYQELQQAYERQKELDRLKDDFILTVSHEFRTPLTAIEGYVTLISRHGQKLDQDKLQAFATEIHQATVQLAGMIGMLADASRMSNQPLRITPQPVNLAAAAEEVISSQPPDAKERISSRIDTNLWVLGDEERLPLVISNLLGNAIKYSATDKPCRISARKVSREQLASAKRAHALGETAPDQWVVVTVEDEGPGISPDDQARLFQKFVRLQQSLVTSVRGTGLGLWICRQYVEAMGGDIWVDSRVGQGSRFSFSLPYTEMSSSDV